MIEWEPEEQTVTFSGIRPGQTACIAFITPDSLSSGIISNIA